MKTLIDANVILRYLLDDVADQALNAELVIQGGAYTLPEVICEVVYVLDGVYNMPRDAIRDSIFFVLHNVAIERLEEVVRALNLYAATRIDFVDCILAAHNQVDRSSVYSFDKKLKKHLNV